jgi:glyoxylase I family protein
MYGYLVPTFPPMAHFALTVSDLDRSIAWYEVLFDAPLSFVSYEGAYRAAIRFEPVFSLQEHRSWCGEDSFDELRIGLDHIAFGCASRQELEGWATRLDELGIERGEIVDAFYGSGLAFRDPKNIQLVFFLPVGSRATAP